MPVEVPVEGKLLTDITVWLIVGAAVHVYHKLLGVVKLFISQSLIDHCITGADLSDTSPVLISITNKATVRFWLESATSLYVLSFSKRQFSGLTYCHLH